MTRVPACVRPVSAPPQQVTEDIVLKPGIKRGISAAVGTFLGHFVAGTLIAAMLMLAAWALGELVYWLDLHSHISRFSLKVLDVLEDTITLGDALLYMCYVVISFITAAKEMIE
jgi:hypothetical protein